MAAATAVMVVTVAGVVASPEADVPAYLVAAQVAAGGEAARDKLDGDHSHQSGNKGGGPRLADKVRGDTASLQKGKQRARSAVGHNGFSLDFIHACAIAWRGCGCVRERP